jgi:spore coat polysaccharide biosynthesis protein SpsF (cytidylyltransferase family)
METAIILQARLGSKRFPSKVLKKINGKTILEYTIKRLKKTKLSKNIIVATTKREEDQKIIKVAKKTNCHTFRGSTNNVLNRYYKAAVHYKVKNIVRICSDCPLIDPKIINKVYFFYLKNNYDYVSNKIFPSYPPGMGVEILNFQSLKKANKLTKNSYDKEHVTPYIYKNPKKFKIKNVGLKKKLLNYRIVLDYIEDFKLISNIQKHFNKQRKDFTLKDIIKYINRNPILKKKNSQNLTKYGYL